jgi:transcriptional regulator with XRE-family HTH domain
LTDQSTIHIGKTLNKLRKQKDLSQEELGFRSNLDRTFISMLERNVRGAGLRTIFRLAKALEMKPHEIVKEIEENEKIDHLFEKDETE